MTLDQKISDFRTPNCAKSHERDNIILFQNIKIIIILSFFHITVLNTVGKCPNSYNIEHCSLNMGNKYLHVTIMTNGLRGVK